MFRWRARSFECDESQSNSPVREGKSDCRRRRSHANMHPFCQGNIGHVVGGHGRQPTPSWKTMAAWYCWTVRRPVMAIRQWQTVVGRLSANHCWSRGRVSTGETIFPILRPPNLCMYTPASSHILVSQSSLSSAVVHT